MSSLPYLEVPWVFSQSHPVTTSDMVSMAKGRGVEVSVPLLRELYHRGDLAPIAEITRRKVTTGIAVEEAPTPMGTMQRELARALLEGRLQDPGELPYRPRLRFDAGTLADGQGWCNGLLYTRWQVLCLPDVRQRLRSARVFGPYERRRCVLPALEERGLGRARKHRRWALVLMVLEARYRPTVDPEWLHLTNVEVAQWHAYRAAFDASTMATRLGVSGEELREHAEHLLLVAHGLDTYGDWSQLIRRAPQRARERLTGDALMVVDHWLAAEMLLLFYEDLVIAGEAEPLPEIPPMAWHPLRERISADRSEPLDSLLAGLGISPHAGVVLVVEGETEEVLVPKVFDHLSIRRTPDLVRILCMRGADKGLSLVAAATAAPLLGERRGDSYEMIRPPTRIMIAVDRDPRWATDSDVQKQRSKIITEIEKVVSAQRAVLSPADLEGLVVVRQWPARCFEFAHFTDAELADALFAVHGDCGGLNREELVARIADVRSRNLDFKDVPDGPWEHPLNKRAVGEALWPVLASKIDIALEDVSVQMPAVAEVAHDAYLLAQQSKYGNYVITAAPGT